MPLTDTEEAVAFEKWRLTGREYRRPQYLRTDLNVYISNHPRHKKISVLEQVLLKNRMLHIIRKKYARKGSKTKLTKKNRLAKQKVHEQQYSFQF